METHANHGELVRAAYDHLFSGDLDSFLDCLHDDCVVHEMESLPYPGSHKGREGIRSLVMVMTSIWQDFRFDIEDLLTGPDTVIAYGQMTVTGRETNRTATFPLVERWKLEGRKAIEITAIYGDTHLARQAAGFPS